MTFCNLRRFEQSLLSHNPFSQSNRGSSREENRSYDFVNIPHTGNRDRSKSSLMGVRNHKPVQAMIKIHINNPETRNETKQEQARTQKWCDE